jgi:hypothetical protein
MLADIAADPTLSSKLTSPSLTAIYNLWCYIVASAINLFEQVQDLYIINAESLALKTPPATPLWIQNQVFNYQYDSSGSPATNVVVINADYSVGYATKNTAFNIVTLCSVNTLPNNKVQVKAAQGTLTAGYSAITGTALTQLDGFLTEILPAGISHNLISQSADYIAVYGTIYYQNGYAGVIKSNVTTALKAYIDSISISNTSGSQSVNYTGAIKVASIESAILGAEGVLDINITRITARPNATAFSASTVVYDLVSGVNNRQYNTAAGYAIAETTTSNTWNDTLIYSAAI